MLVKDKKHTISVHAEKTFDKIQHPFMIREKEDSQPNLEEHFF